MNVTARSFLQAVVRALVKFAGSNRTGRYLFNQILQNGMNRVSSVNHGGVELRFASPNPLCEWRAKTFSSKEPETLAWIDAIPEGATVWDVGANIGLYSVYAAKTRYCKVFAFEPSVFNLELLARNSFINDVTDRICIVPLALSDGLGFSKMQMSTTEWGGALSTFGKEFGWDGERIRPVLEFQTMGLSMDDAVVRLGIPPPDYIKMDVDGIEHFILQGGTSVLTAAKSVLIEVNDGFADQAAACHKLLTEAGLIMTDKLHSELISASTTGFQHCYNQIWCRS